jgi:hypothetical protein
MRKKSSLMFNYNADKDLGLNSVSHANKIREELKDTILTNHLYCKNANNIEIVINTFRKNMFNSIKENLLKQCNYFSEDKIKRFF